MNLPNKLTMLRVILIPFFFVFMMLDETSWGKWVALGIFIVASLTDLFDGKIARKYNLVTNFGKFMDPLADKLLVCTAMIVLMSLGRIPTVVVVVIIAREFIISGFRLVASDGGIVIAASMWGKVKTTVQMVMVIFLICDLGVYFQGSGATVIMVIEQILIWASLILTVVSLVDYLIKNKEVISDFK